MAQRIAPPSGVLADPLGVVVDLIAELEPALNLPVIEEVVGRVAGGRAKRRRLAQALADEPKLLTQGRSPAPRVVGNLLIALRNAGAVRVSPPVCAECDKPLRTLQRRGQDWYCGGCGPRREPCTACGQTRVVSVRDRDGGPRCGQCPPEDERDPVDVIVEVVARVDPALPPEVVVAAVHASVSQVGQRRRLAWALAGRPDLLTGAGAQAPVPSVLRLIDKLRDAGATAVLAPACPHCGRVIALVKPRGGVRLCRNCVAKSRAQPCSRCGAIREAATRDEQGEVLCPNCLITDPANQETCIDCGRRRRVSTRTPQGPLCESCRPWKTLTCNICGRHTPCVISQATGKPWCRACKQRWTRCSGCGEVRPVRGGTIEQPLCSTCTRSDPEFWRSCPGCGQPGRIHLGRCARCTVQRRLRELLGDDTGEIRPELRALYQALTATDRPATVSSWLDTSAAPAILRGLSAGRPLTHQSLDELPAGKSVEHLRSVLVCIGTLPARDEQMTRLERWITRTIAERPDPDEQHLLHRYAVWHLLRRLRRRVGDADTTHTQAVVVRQHVKAATTLLDWLTAHTLTLATARQGDIETWLTSENAAHRREAGAFVRWAHRQKLTSLDVAAIGWDGPTQVIDTEARWDQARRLLHDDTLTPEDRVAGLLVVLYAQWPAAISRLTLDHIDATEHQVRLRLGHEPVVLPEPLAALVRQITATRRGHAAIGDPATSRWLFPGGQPGRPISSHQLGERLRQLGLRPGQARSTALFQLATDLPAALLARMLGIHISVAVAWQRAAAGDWMS
ncbi:MAG: hypothetical protein ACRDQ9_10855, partial [Pseudonocardiaceae bacterium]